MAKTSKPKRDPNAPRGSHVALPISEDELLIVANSLREMSGNLRTLAATVAASKAGVAKLKSWTTFSKNIKAAMKISGKFAADFAEQELESVTGFGKQADDAG